MVASVACDFVTSLSPPSPRSSAAHRAPPPQLPPRVRRRAEGGQREVLAEQRGGPTGWSFGCRTCTVGSRVLEGCRPPFDAKAVRKLRESGAIIFGKANLDDFGIESTTEGFAYQGFAKKIVRECRICQEEDEEHEMETPCTYTSSNGLENGD